MMLSKRDFVKQAAVAGAAALVVPVRAVLLAPEGTALVPPVGASLAPPSADPAAFDVAAYNDLFPQARTFAAELSERGVRTLAVDGDAGRLWYETLRGLVDGGARRIAGMTTHTDLLILETLARDKGLRIRQRNPVGGARLVSWVLL
jgi:hypothetical protein